MPNNSFRRKPLSLKFVISVFIVFIVLIFYISYPTDFAGRNQKKSFEEMLEYNIRFKQGIKSKKEITKSDKNEVFSGEENVFEEEEIPDIKQKTETSSVSPASRFVLYNKLLDELAEYPSYSELSVQKAVIKLLEFKGYPSDTLKAVISDIDQSSSKTTDSYMLAGFDFLTGEMHISKKMVYDMDIKSVIAVLAHELDHFDKLAKVCKSVGIENFNKIFTDNGIDDLNKNFWIKAASHTGLDNFNVDLYEDALKRLLTQKDLEQTSSYSDFYRLSENMRNPLEISAYKESDYVYNYFQIPVIEGNMQRLSRIFNEIDWGIYDFAKKNQILQEERIALFDLFFAGAILTTTNEFSSEFKNCENNKNGDLTTFWQAFENKYSSFYKQGKMSNQMCDEILELLNAANNLIKKGITPLETAKALQFKINTLKSNLVYPNSLKNLRKSAINYLKYLKEEKIQNPAQELNTILIILCIDNQLYTKNANKEISLYNLKIPQELAQLYVIKSKNRRFAFIYSNEEFKEFDYDGNEGRTLIGLLNKSRLNIKF